MPLESYFTGYRKSVREPGELIRAVRIPLPVAPLAAFHKIAKRRFDDISSVAVAFALDVRTASSPGPRSGSAASRRRRCAPPPPRPPSSARPWTADTARDAAAVLRGEGTPIDDHRASAAYRAAMLGQSLLKFHTETAPLEVTA